MAVLAADDSSRKCGQAQSLGRRRFATKETVGRTWMSKTELVQADARASTEAWRDASVACCERLVSCRGPPSTEGLSTLVEERKRVL